MLRFLAAEGVKWPLPAEALQSAESEKFLHKLFMNFGGA